MHPILQPLSLPRSLTLLPSNFLAYNDDVLKIGSDGDDISLTDDDGNNGPFKAPNLLFGGVEFFFFNFFSDTRVLCLLKSFRLVSSDLRTI